MINYNFVKQTCHFRKHLLKRYSKKITKQLFSLTESRGNVFYMIIVEVEFGKATVVVTKTNDTHTIFLRLPSEHTKELNKDTYITSNMFKIHLIKVYVFMVYFFDKCLP